MIEKNSHKTNRKIPVHHQQKFSKIIVKVPRGYRCRYFMTFKTTKTLRDKNAQQKDKQPYF